MNSKWTRPACMPACVSAKLSSCWARSATRCGEHGRTRSRSINCRPSESWVCARPDSAMPHSSNSRRNCACGSDQIAEELRDNHTPAAEFALSFVSQQKSEAAPPLQKQFSKPSPSSCSTAGVIRLLHRGTLLPVIGLRKPSAHAAIFLRGLDSRGQRAVRGQ